MVVRRFTARAAYSWLLLFLLATPLAAQQTLVAKYRQGDRTQTETRNETVSNVSVVGQTQSIKSSSLHTINTVEQVVAVEPTQASVTKAIERIRLSIKGPQGVPINFDSSDDQEPTGPLAQVAPLLRALIGLEFTSVMNARGELLSSDAGERMAAALKRDPKLADSFDKVLPEDSLKEIAGMSALALPEGPVQVGDTWKSSKTLQNPLLGKQNVEITYTYAGPVEHEGRQVSRISYEQLYEFGDKPDESLKIKVRQQTFEGEILFDPEIGRMLQSNARQTIELEIARGANQIVQRVETKLTTRVTPATAEAPAK
jgi:hypothetical protein